MLRTNKHINSAYSPTVSGSKATYFFNFGSNVVKFTDSNSQTDPIVIWIHETCLEWLKEKLQHYSSDAPVPIFQEPSKIIVQEIMSKLRGAHLNLDGISQVQINICAGHVFFIHKINDRIEYDGQEFFQQLPLFLEISIEIQSVHPVLRHSSCQVAVALEILQDNNNNNLPELLTEEMPTNSLGALWRNIGTTNHPALQP
ncbi:1947_t:CDS:2 [Ambispora leptoticha]|uniref:1947_t:CDS:1 n=1 Tax=Ambispora leptoticha TaxID=144679 RepID=A0A9N9A4X3_9GLOM|nr:1947_t:CDS:2 [Ambispora leptoticha]